jgi:two-component system, sensor histidine kinase ChiS
LGLFISRKIIELHHGTLQVHSVPQQGSRFTIRLPLA